MINTKCRLVGALLPLALLGCAKGPDSICKMPANEHFWQGMEVTWRGELLSLNAGMHGRSLILLDWNCAREIRLDQAKTIVAGVTALQESRTNGVADFEISGRIEVSENRALLIPAEMRQITPWITGTKFWHHERAQWEGYRRTKETEYGKH